MECRWSRAVLSPRDQVRGAAWGENRALPALSYPPTLHLIRCININKSYLFRVAARVWIELLDFCLYT